MYKILLLLVCSASSFFALGATRLCRISPAVTIVEGHLDHAPAGDTIRLYCGQQQTKTVLSPSGDFKLLVNGLKKASSASFSYARQRTVLYLTPGDHLHLVLDFRVLTNPCAIAGAEPLQTTTWPGPCGALSMATPTRGRKTSVPPPPPSRKCAS